ncbi:hypothetical protein [Streptomyces sp. NBC_01314]|uniref:hypothetical protein n=1 Tax=Streptomyces sp. NBC_01314 TaxID=2903821 RepID=UPI00308E9927|nr:hypothetical protein OG622_44490 [Streptomyces sp. NBC_01314]
MYVDSGSQGKRVPAGASTASELSRFSAARTYTSSRSAEAEAEADAEVSAAGVGVGRSTEPTGSSREIAAR